MFVRVVRREKNKTRKNKKSENKKKEMKKKDCYEFQSGRTSAFSSVFLLPLSVLLSNSSFICLLHLPFA